MFPLASRAALRRSLSRPHEEYLRSKSDKEPADEGRMMENHRCYGNGGGGGLGRRPCDTLSMKMDQVRRTEDQHSKGKSL